MTRRKRRLSPAELESIAPSWSATRQYLSDDLLVEAFELRRKLHIQRQAIKVLPRIYAPARSLANRPLRRGPSRERGAGRSATRRGRARSPGRSTDDDPEPARRALARLQLEPEAAA
jgi:hypothetical protein